MADLKISALTGATTPLAGTEVLPIVQSGVTVKVASDNLTVKNLRSNATSGILQVAGPAAASTRVVTVPDANWTAARTDAAQTFIGDQTLSTGNLIVSSGKGIDFSATPGTGTSELLADYEEGTWTPTLNSFTVVNQTALSGTYTKIGRQVFLNIIVTATSIAAVAGSSTITNLPFAPSIQNFSMVTLANANTIAATNSGGTVNSTSSGTLYPPSTSGNTYMVISAVYTV